MKLLLDTHVVIWWGINSPQLSDRATVAIEHAGNEALLSAVVIWEIAIKRGYGQLKVDDGDVNRVLDGGALPLLINFDHVRAVERLPDHHRDPFDRLLIAQARVENATIVTNDPLIARYGVPVLW